MQAPQSSSASRTPSSLATRDPAKARPTVPHTATESACPLADAAGLAHDAGNLLGGLRLYCDLLDRPGVLAPAHRHYASELRLIAERSSRLLERLLAHIDTASVPEPALALLHNSAAPPCDPAAVLHELAPLLRRMVGPEITIDLQAPRSLPPGAFSVPSLTAEILERIVLNLVCNAAKVLAAARRPGRIRIRLRPAASALRLEIQDDGPGLAPGIAEAFLAPSPAPPRAPHGLGHRIVHELTQATGGGLTIDSTAGLGTVFSLHWNQTDSAAASVAPAADNPIPTAGRPPLSRSGARTRTASPRSQEDSVRAC